MDCFSTSLHPQRPARSRLQIPPHFHPAPSTSTRTTSFPCGTCQLPRACQCRHAPSRLAQPVSPMPRLGTPRSLSWSVAPRAEPSRRIFSPHSRNPRVEGADGAGGRQVLRMTLSTSEVHRVAVEGAAGGRMSAASWLAADASRPSFASPSSRSSPRSSFGLLGAHHPLSPPPRCSPFPPLPHRPHPARK